MLSCAVKEQSTAFFLLFGLGFLVTPTFILAEGETTTRGKADAHPTDHSPRFCLFLQDQHARQTPTLPTTVSYLPGESQISSSVIRILTLPNTV